MATKKRTVKSKPKAAKPATSIATTKAAGSRKLKANKYRSFRLSKPIKSPHEKLPNSFRIFAVSLKILRDNWKPFLGIVLIYGVLMVILVRGLGGGIQLDFLKATFQKAAKGTFNSVTNSLSLFAYLVGTAGNSQSDAGSVYQAILILVISLATIWGLRQVIAGTKVRIRDTFYRGMYPLIPFILVLVVIALQLLPLIIGNWFFHIVMANSIAVTLLEKFLWGLLFALLALLSIYMVCSSVFALYIVTLPDMTPLKALRSARQLVLHRRWSVIRKVLFLPIILIIISAIIMVPLILWLTPAAQWVFFGLTMVTLVVVHSYMYTLYRELL